MTEPVQRTIKGGRAAFFENPESDRILCMLMKMMSEHWALKERVLTLEALLLEHDILPAGAVASYRPAAEENARRDQQSFAFIQSVIEAAQNVDTRHRDP